MDKKELDLFWKHLEELFPAPITNRNHGGRWTVSIPGQIQAVFERQEPSGRWAKNGSVELRLLMLNQERAQKLRHMMREVPFSSVLLDPMRQVVGVGFLTERWDGMEGMCCFYTFHKRVFYARDILGALGVIRMLEEPILDFIEGYLLKTVSGKREEPKSSATFYHYWKYLYAKTEKGEKGKP